MTHLRKLKIFWVVTLPQAAVILFLLITFSGAAALDGYIDNISGEQPEEGFYTVPAQNQALTPTAPATFSAGLSDLPVSIATVASNPVPETGPKQDTGKPWGVAEQVDAHTWTMKVGQDSRMATPGEIFAALNTYRNQHGRNSLNWDGRLAAYAQLRAETFANNGGLDDHSGFSAFVNNTDNLKSLGFWSVGENASYGYQLLGTHLIEWVYAGDAGHDSNQLDPSWSHVGVGVEGTATDLIFGGYRM